VIASRESGFAFSTPPVQTLVQAGEGVVASDSSASLAIDGPLIVDQVTNKPAGRRMGVEVDLPKQRHDDPCD
jgi:hypothetical protein